MPGTWQSVSDGRWVFFEPTASNTPTGALTSPGTNPHFADITKCVFVAAHSCRVNKVMTHLTIGMTIYLTYLTKTYMGISDNIIIASRTTD